MEQYLIGGLILSGGAASVFFKKLTIPAALSGGIIALFVYAGSGLTGFAIMTTFFILATLATAFNKKHHGASKIEKEQRNAGQVWANAGLAGIIGFLAFCYEHDVVPMLIASVFSSATADTISSEMGMATGKRFYNILNLKKDQKGLDGVVSMEGTLFGVAGSALIACIYCVGYGWSAAFIIILIAGTAGNFSDSCMGATLERKGMAGNDLVNFLNTLVAVLVATLLWYFISR